MNLTSTSNSSRSSAQRRENPLLRLFSSVRFGVILLSSILIYAAIGSAVAPLRGMFEMTEMQVFRHWLFVTLVALFCITLTVTTVRRIRLNWTNAGVWTVHTGLLLLTAGSVIYFGRKVEGDFFAASPRVELISNGRLAQALRAGVNESLTLQAPMLVGGDGAIKLLVLSTETNANKQVTAANLQVQLGDDPSRQIRVEAGKTLPLIAERLGVRLWTAPPVTEFYDDDVVGIYCEPVEKLEAAVAGEQKEKEPAFLALPGLPIHRERYIAEHPLQDTQGNSVASARTQPALTLGPVRIPTGWFEPWRLPIRAANDQAQTVLPFDVEVAGYVPYAEGLKPALCAGGRAENPAVKFSVRAESRGIDATLFANDPGLSISDTPMPFEFRWVKSAADLAGLVAPLPGPHELSIRVLNPPAQMTVAVAEGQTVRVEGTPYVIKVGRAIPAWPLMSPGFENALSAALRVDVAGGPQPFNRTIIERFPQFTQDIDAQGKRHTDQLVDPNILLTYRSAPRGLILAGPEMEPLLAMFHPSGRVQKYPLRLGKTESVELDGAKFDFTLDALETHAQESRTVVITPVEVRRPNLGRSRSAILVKLTGRDQLKDWSYETWVPFAVDVDEGRNAALVRTPDQREFRLQFGRALRPLGFEVLSSELSVEFFPGGRDVQSWRTNLWIREPGEEPHSGSTYMNHTHSAGNWTLFQSTAAPDHWSWSGIGVGNREGIWPMLLGCVLIPLGSMYAFYVKPLIIRARQRAALDAARRTGRLPARVPEEQTVASART